MHRMNIRVSTTHAVVCNECSVTNLANGKYSLATSIPA